MPKDKRVYCDCGSPLIFCVDKVVENVQFHITRSGQISKRPIKGTDGTGSKGSDYNYGRLICENCLNRYEFDYSVAQKHVIRGDLM